MKIIGSSVLNRVEKQITIKWKFDNLKWTTTEKRMKRGPCGWWF